MIKLMIAQEDQKVQNAIVPVRWCVERETLEELERKRVNDPYLLLVTVIDRGEDDSGCYRYKEADRKLVPLSQLMEYISFSGSGKYIILAVIVLDKHNNTKDLHRKFILRSHNEYIDDIIDRNSSGCEIRQLNLGSGISTLGNAAINVVVPKELFAKEPPEWEKWWVNFWYESRPKDQCQYRRRRVLAYTIQPFALLIWVPLKLWIRFVVAVFLLMCGMRKVDLKPLIHPFSYDVNDIWSEVGDAGSIFLHTLTEDGKEKSPGHAIFMPFAPIFLAPLFVGLVLGLGGVIQKLLLITLGVAATISFAIALFIAAALVLEASGKITSRWFSRIWTLHKHNKVAKEIYGADSQLICNGNFRADLSALPKERRTVYLRYMDLKAKLCRPFAQ